MTEIDLRKKELGYGCCKEGENKYVISLHPINEKETLRIILKEDQFYLTCLDMFNSLPTELQDDLPEDPW